MNSLRSPWKEDVEKLNIYAGEKTRRDMEYKEGEYSECLGERERVRAVARVPSFLILLIPMAL